MKIRINDRPDIQEIEVIINCVADDPLVNKIISALNTVDAKLLCRRQGETFQLGLADILYIESVDIIAIWSITIMRLSPSTKKVVVKQNETESQRY